MERKVMLFGGEGSLLWRFPAGMVFGVAATFVYVRFGLQLPDSPGLEQQIVSQAMVTTAELDLYNPSAHPLIRRRALAVLLACQPDLFLEIDEAIGYRFFREFLRRKAPHLPSGPFIMPGPDSLATKHADVSSGVMLGPSEILPGLTTSHTRLSPDARQESGQSGLRLRRTLELRFPDATPETIDWLTSHPELLDGIIVSAGSDRGRQARPDTQTVIGSPVIR